MLASLVQRNLLNTLCKLSSRHVSSSEALVVVRRRLFEVAGSLRPSQRHNDGRIDLFVANDTTANSLFMNRGHGKFETTGLDAGVAYDEMGRARSGVGVDSADYDQDGWMDLFVADVDQEKYSLYHNSHDGAFTDESTANGIGAATFLMSGWGLKFFDFDNDGNLDLFLANGHPDDRVEKQFADVTYDEALPLFRNTGGDFKNAFENVSADQVRHLATASSSLRELQTGIVEAAAWRLPHFSWTGFTCLTRPTAKCWYSVRSLAT